MPFTWVDDALATRAGAPWRWLMLALLIGLAWLPGKPALAAAAGNETVWYSAGTAADGGPVIDLYLFWSKRCPHCLEAYPFVTKLAQEYPWLRLHSHELTQDGAGRQRFAEMAAGFQQQARSYPSFFFCNAMLVGYDNEQVTGGYIRDYLTDCRQRLMAGQGLPPQLGPDQAALGQFTGIDFRDMSLPLITLVIAGLDAFNPCAFFVLLSLLSLLVHAKSRARMLFIGGVFVVFSGLIYFVFMAAWLNAFLLMGQIGLVTLVAGLVAILFSLFNIKDWFLAGVGPSLSIPESAKPGIFQRMRALLSADNFVTLTLGTVVLAIAVNSYELLCTSGLPLVYTRLLTLEQLPTSTYYLYLAAYNTIYVIPLLIIVILFAASLGSRKLQADEGRALKLLSGLMMLGLGLLLVIAPEALSNVLIALGIIAGAIAITAAAYLFDRYRHPQAPL